MYNIIQDTFSSLGGMIRCFLFYMSKKLVIIKGKLKCNKCNTSKPLKDFYINNNSHTGHRTPCKSCISKKLKATNLNNPSIMKEVLDLPGEIWVDVVGYDDSF